jgi:hypothetical protein
MIFMTSNLGANEMTSMLRPNLGFAAIGTEGQRAAGIVESRVSGVLRKGFFPSIKRKRLTPAMIGRSKNGHPSISNSKSFYRRGCQEKYFPAELEAARKVAMVSSPPSCGLLQLVAVARYSATRFAVKRRLCFPSQFILKVHTRPTGGLGRLLVSSFSLSLFKGRQYVAVEAGSDVVAFGPFDDSRPAGR